MFAIGEGLVFLCWRVGGDIELLNVRHLQYFTICTLPKTNSSHLKMDGWKANFLI